MTQPNPALFWQWNFDVPIVSLALNRRSDWVGAALADGSMRLLPAHDEVAKPTAIALHNGISLSLVADSDDHAFLSGGDDGKVLIIDPMAGSATLLAEHKNKWIDHVAGSPEGGFRAYSVGKQAHILNAEGEEKATLPPVPSNVGGMAFSPNGKRLAVSHYNGVSLFWANAKDSLPTKLVWNGSHLNVAWHPSGKMVLTGMQENSLHGWRLADNYEMRMQGYAGKIHSMAFTVKDKYLATSGSDQVICWPFFGGGPWGKAPLTLGGREARLVTRVAPHPKDEMVAAGYNDGMIILAPLDGRMEIMIHQPLTEKTCAVTGLGWNKDGDCLYAALEHGSLLLFTIDSVRKAVAHV